MVTDPVASFSSPWLITRAFTLERSVRRVMTHRCPSSRLVSWGSARHVPVGDDHAKPGAPLPLQHVDQLLVGGGVELSGEPRARFSQDRLPSQLVELQCEASNRCGPSEALT
jgi:hypothetical protein